MISVTKWKDTWFMCEFDTEEKLQQKATETERQKEMCYWGYKFEQYMTSGITRYVTLLSIIHMHTFVESYDKVIIDSL